MDIKTIVMDNLGSITAFMVNFAAIAFLWTSARNVFKQVYELFAVIVDGMEDNTLTGEEVNRIIKEGGDVVGAVKQAIANSKVK